MGFFYSVRGWFEGDDQHIEQARRIINQNVDQNPYCQSWHIPETGGGFSRFFFFGHTVRDSSLADVRNQVSRLATDIQSTDGADVDYLRGVFHVTAEDDSKHITWECAGGHFTERDVDK